MNNVKTKHITAHIFLGACIILSLSSVMSIIMVMATRETKAFLPNFGGVIQSYTPVCIYDILTGQCDGCPACSQQYGPLCDKHSEVLFSPAPGSAYNFICPPSSQVYLGGGAKPRPGGFILGNGLQLFPFQVGVSP